MAIDEQMASLFKALKKQVGPDKEGHDRVFHGDDLSMGSVVKYGIPSGIPEMDLYLGQRGGYPAGKIIEFYGKPMCSGSYTHINYHVRNADGMYSYFDGTGFVLFSLVSTCSFLRPYFLGGLFSSDPTTLVKPALPVPLTPSLFQMPRSAHVATSCFQQQRQESCGPLTHRPAVDAHSQHQLPKVTCPREPVYIQYGQYCV